jgi:hypothetical protein
MILQDLGNYLVQFGHELYYVDKFYIFEKQLPNLHTQYNTLSLDEKDYFDS